MYQVGPVAAPIRPDAVLPLVFRDDEIRSKTVRRQPRCSTRRGEDPHALTHPGEIIELRGERLVGAHDHDRRAGIEVHAARACGWM